MRSRASFERLEDRRLLSLTIDLRLAGGGKDITVDHVGQVVNLEAWAVVTGNNGVISDDGLQSLVGSFLSGNSGGGGSARGDMSATRVSPFDANGSTDPSQADLDGDGDLDAGSNNDPNAAGFFAARSASVTTGGAPSALGGAEFKIADVTFTVTSLLSGGGTTQLNFRPRATSPAWTSALWQEDGLRPLKIASTGTYVAGTPVIVQSTGGTGVGSISGSVVNDANQSGTRDAGDSPLVGWTVFLDDDQNGKLDSGERSDLTDAQGNYRFDSLTAGTYHVAQLIHSGYAQIAPQTPRNDVALAAGENRQGVLFADSTLGQIRGIVYRDENQNGKFDAGDVAQGPGWRVFIDTNKNGQFDTGEQMVETNASGAYTLKLLSPAQYRVMAQPGSSAYFATTPNPRTVTVPSAGSIVSDQNFGFALPSGTISGTVWNDKDADGVHDSNEIALGNWRVYLDANKNALLDAGEQSTLTDENGMYTFTDLPNGSYRVRETLSAGFRRVTPSSGFYDVTINNSSDATGKDFGNTKLAVIYGSVFKDVDGNGVRSGSGEIGLSGWRVFDDGNGNGKLDAGEASALTDSAGNYVLNVGSGWHIIRVQGNAGYKLTTPLYYKVLVGESTRVYNKVFGEKPV